MADDLIIEALRVEAQGTPLIANISARFAPGQLTAIVGPNGAGKSTLLRAMAGVVPAQGAIRMGTADVTSLRSAERARRLAYLPQVHELAWDISVADMVALGRFSYGAAPGRLSTEGQGGGRARNGRHRLHRPCASRRYQPVGAAKRHSPVSRASSPPKRRSCSSTNRFAALDPANQYRVMECLAALAADGRTVVAVLHDLSLVAQFSDTVLWMAGGRLVAQTPATHDAFAQHVPALFAREPAFASDGSSALYFRRSQGT